MKILVGKTFGIGNSVLSIPMIKLLSTLGSVDVLIGSTNDDFGAFNVFNALKKNYGFIENIFIDNANNDFYDVAIMSIPFDGRWKNGIHFNAKKVLDCRKRPGNVVRLGFDMWEKHESLYQIDNYFELIGKDEVFNSGITSEFLKQSDKENLIYVGIGYKKDAGGFGQSKHFGNENFIDLLNQISEKLPDVKFISTVATSDVENAKKIKSGVKNYDFKVMNLDDSFIIITKCKAYIGNDTGMMHVAASCDIPTYGLFLSRYLVVKNHPWMPLSNKWGASSINIKPISEVVDNFMELLK